MVKDKLIESLCKKTGLSNKIAKEIIETIFEEISWALSRGEDVTLSGFGKFLVVLRKERKGRNPRTGEEIIIPEAKVPKFKAGKILKEIVK